MPYQAAIHVHSPDTRRFPSGLKSRDLMPPPSLTRTVMVVLGGEYTIRCLGEAAGGGTLRGKGRPSSCILWQASCKGHPHSPFTTNSDSCTIDVKTSTCSPSVKTSFQHRHHVPEDAAVTRRTALAPNPIIPHVVNCRVNLPW